MTDTPSPQEEQGETIQGIADYLQQENPDLDKFQAWNEALDIYRTSFGQRVMPPPEPE